jgi:hypothetical protein
LFLPKRNRGDMSDKTDNPEAPAATPSNDQGWVDRLVELHVLAEHGDTSAARQAEEWVARDPSARTLWESVERECSEVREGHPRSAL